MTGRARTSLQAGVTLIELAAAICLIAMLIAIGIPAYRHHALRVNSGDAPRELLTVAQRLQACHKRTGNYTRLDDVPNTCVALPYPITEGTYRISGEVMSDSFLLRATPIGSQAADTRCKAFTFDHLGRQGITGTATAADCWGQRQN